MSKNLIGTITEKNLSNAFAGESQARNRYSFYAEKAKEEGHIHIARVFYETADNERAHAKVFFDFLNSANSSLISVASDYPIGLSTTCENLKFAALGENEEWSGAYPNFAKVAEDEGFLNISTAFKNIIEIEKDHEKRYLDLLDRLKTNSLYSSTSEKLWKCINCGFVYSNVSAPQNCPVCGYAKEYFEVKIHENLK